MSARFAILLSASVMLGGCESSFIKEETLVGDYRANWNSGDRLILNDDGTYLMSNGGVGEWYISWYVGDVSVNFRPIEGQGATYDVQRSTQGQIRIVMDANRDRFFAKVD